MIRVASGPDQGAHLVASPCSLRYVSCRNAASPGSPESVVVGPTPGDGRPRVLHDRRLGAASRAQRGSSHPNGDHGANGRRARGVFGRREAACVQRRCQDRRRSHVALGCGTIAKHLGTFVAQMELTLPKRHPRTTQGYVLWWFVTL